MIQPEVLFLLPILGKQPEWYPRFRGVHLEDPSRPEWDGKLQIACYVGGVYKADYMDHIEIVRKHPNYIGEYEDADANLMFFAFTYDHSFDADIELIKVGNFKSTSKDYQDLCKRIYADTPQLVAMMEDWFQNADGTLHEDTNCGCGESCAGHA